MKFIKKIIYPHKYNTDVFIKYLKQRGVEIGEHTKFINPVNTYVDEQNASYISIGNKCCITAGVTILAHDWSICVVAEKYGQMLPGQRRTIIGNNVFIGLNSIILSGTVIEDNVVIGAGSVVSGKIEADSVYAGNPARKIMSLEDYFEKCKKRYIPGAKEYAANFVKIYGRVPKTDEMGCYQTMFIDKEMISDNMFADSIYKNAYLGVPKMFDSVQDLIDYKEELF